MTILRAFRCDWCRNDYIDTPSQARLLHHDGQLYKVADICEACFKSAGGKITRRRGRPRKTDET